MTRSGRSAALRALFPIALMLFSAACEKPKVVQVPVGAEFTEAIFWRSSKEQSPAVLLIPRAGGSKEAWLPLARKFQKAGFGILALDLRGQGSAGPQSILEDVRAAFSYLRMRPRVDAARIGLVGIAGGHVRKGEHGTGIIFWKLLSRENKETKELDKFPMLRGYTVFNMDQTEDIDPEKLKATSEKPDKTIQWEGVEAAEHIAKGIACPITYGGNRACYTPTGDKITMPERHQFKGAENFYATLLHEGVHSTGHPQRLDRDQKGVFGTQSYAFEELIAELGSAMLLGTIGLEATVENHASYLRHWVSLLQSDKRAIFRASSRAQKAADWLIDRALVKAAA